jgi:hypothetical protein
MLLPTGFPRPCTELHGHCKRTTENPPQRNQCGADCKGHVLAGYVKLQNKEHDRKMLWLIASNAAETFCSLVVTMGAEDLAGTYEPLAVPHTPQPSTSITKITEFQYYR